MESGDYEFSSKNRRRTWRIFRKRRKIVRQEASYASSIWHYAPTISDDALSDHDYDVLAYLYGLGIMDRKAQVKSNHVRITYGDISTRMLLYPRTTYKLEAKEMEIPIDESGRCMQLTRNKGKSEKVSYELEEPSNQLAAYLRRLDTFEYNDHIYDITRCGEACGWDLRTHFVSAMVLLARSVGIPARIVEGYAISMTEQKNYEVNDSGHMHGWKLILKVSDGLNLNQHQPWLIALL